MPLAPPVTGVAVPLLGGLLLLLVLGGLVLWYRSYRVRDEPPPPEIAGDTPPPPAERDETWDPRERYDG